MKVSKILKIRGRVQGVYYRESMRQEAMRLGVTGWVRNRRDGSVEALVQGESSLVAELVNWCHRGPPAAHVEAVEELASDGDPTLADFLRRETT